MQGLRLPGRRPSRPEFLVRITLQTKIRLFLGSLFDCVQDTVLVLARYGNSVPGDGYGIRGLEGCIGHIDKERAVSADEPGAFRNPY